MDTIFIVILNMSIVAGWLILAVLLSRGVLYKLPKWFRCVLWALVAIRLVCPWFVESGISLVPSAKVVPTDIADMEQPKITTGLEFLNSTINPILQDSFGESIESNSVLNNTDIYSDADNKTGKLSNDRDISELIDTLSAIWLIGICAMTIYYVVSYVNIKHRVKISMRLYDNVYLCDNIESAFILGVIRPKIFVPSQLSEEELQCVVAHERAHLKSHDNIWKPFAFILLTVYWFNPLVWIAYIMFCRDIELACDERVIRKMGVEGIKEYSKALLSCSVSRKMIVSVPLAFGEVGVKTRIKSVINYKKPVFWIMIISVLAVSVLAATFLTNPTSVQSNKDEKDSKFAEEENTETTIEATTDANIYINYIGEEKNAIKYYSLDDMYCITLDTINHTCYFDIPMASISGYKGKYYMSGDKLILTFDDINGEKTTRVFDKSGDKLVYDIYGSTNYEIVNMTLKNGAVFVLEGSDVKEEEIKKVIGDGVLGCDNQIISIVPIDELEADDDVYVRSDLRLYQIDKTFTYLKSIYTGFMLAGHYEYDGNRLVLYTSEYNGGGMFVFIRVEDQLIYSEKESVLPDDLSGDSDPRAPFKDGTVYVLKGGY